MKTSEKLDLILKELYLYREDNDYQSLNRAIQNAGITLSKSRGLAYLAHKLANDGFIMFKDLDFDLKAKMTLKGISFCEKTSFAYPDHPIITHP